MPTATALSTLLTSVGKNLSVHADYGVGAPGVPMTWAWRTGGALRGWRAGIRSDGISGDMAPTRDHRGRIRRRQSVVDVQTLSIALGLGTTDARCSRHSGKGDPKWTVTRLGCAAGCTAVQEWLARRSRLVRDAGNMLPLCDQACAAKVCSRGHPRAWSMLARDGILGVDSGGAHSTISPDGQAQRPRSYRRRSVDDLGPSPVMGNWGKASARTSRRCERRNSSHCPSKKARQPCDVKLCAHSSPCARKGCSKLSATS